MNSSENPFDRPYVPLPHDENTLRKVETAGPRQIVTDFDRNYRIVSQDIVVDSRLSTRTAYDPQMQVPLTVQTPTHTEHFEYEADGRLRGVSTVYPSGNCPSP